MQRKPVSIAIDFGTYYTKIAYFDEVSQQPVLILDDYGHGEIPSVIEFIEPKDGQRTRFGYEALNSMKKYMCVSHLKRLIGRKIYNNRRI